MWTKWISGILHPLLMPLVTLVLVFGMDPYLQSLPEVFVYMGVVVLVNTLAPAVSIFVLYRRGLLSDLDIRNRKERSLPFFLVLAYFHHDLCVVGDESFHFHSLDLFGHVDGSNGVHWIGLGRDSTI